MKKLLIIDDDKNILEIFQDSLEDFKNLEITTALSGDLAKALLEKNAYDLVISDILIPGINGLEIINFIRENFPKTKVIACSGGGESGSILAGIALDQAIDQGALSALMKPFTTEELRKKVVDTLKL